MPLYEFYCENCGFSVEEIQAYDAPFPVCTECDAGEMKRAVGRPAVRRGAGLFSMDGPDTSSFGEME